MDRAQALFQDATNIDPTFAAAYNKLAGIYSMRNDHMNALTFSTLALQRKPRDFGALAAQGYALAAMAGCLNRKIVLHIFTLCIYIIM